MSVTLDQLYSGKANLSVMFKESEHKFDVELTKDEFNGKTLRFDKSPDCLISSWGANRWFRTDKGANRQAYKSIGNLKQAISRTAKSRGLTVEGFILSKS